MTTITKRSCHGCVRCKRRRQKCDERKPSCGRCSDAGETCEYKLTLKWNGRVPRKPKTARQEEVQVWNSNPQDSRGELSRHNTRHPHNQDLKSPRLPTLSIHLSQPSSVLNSTSRLLLHHFITEASKISSSAYIRDQICRTILPMTHQSESLLYATMAFSSLHRYTLLNELPNRFLPEDLVASLIASSMRCLRRDLEIPGYPVQPLLHTIRTLCHCEIFSGRANSSWRVHVNGAGAMFAQLASRRDLDESEYSFWLWSRWFWSIQALSAVTDIGTLSALTSSESTAQECNESYFFDTYTGYSSDLNPMLMEIGSMVHQEASSESGDGFDIPIDDFQRQEKANILECSIKRMIARDKDRGLKLPDHVSLSPETTRQFQASNTAYQYSSLLHLYKRVKGLPTLSPVVQCCVRAILDSVSSIIPVTTLSPWILLTTPIYTAGCEAMGQDRQLVRELLQELYFNLHIRNILRALEILEQRWEDLDNSSSLLLGSLRSCKAEVDKAEGLDFIPY